MVTAEWLGGPLDGLEMAVEDHFVRYPIRIDTDEHGTNWVEVIVVPVEQDEGGKFVLRWPQLPLTL